jgi:spermidine synthase
MMAESSKSNSMTKCPSGKSLPAVLLTCLFLSGALSLIYEVLWIRGLGLVFGTTVIAMTTVLAVYFCGLALGNRIFGKMAGGLRNPLRMYSFLEFGIGIFAALFSFMGQVSGQAYMFLYPVVGNGIVVHTVLRIAFFAAVLIVPTTMMGGTLPLLSRYCIRTCGSIGRLSGLLYSVNTFGAVAGVSFCGFFSVRFFGVEATNYSAAMMNVIVSLVAYRYARNHPLPAAVTQETLRQQEVSPSSASSSLISRLMPAGLLLSGFAALGYEIVWTRYLSLPLSNTRSTYTIIIAVFLLGTAIGSLIFSRFADRIKNSVRFFGMCQLAAAFSAFLLVPLVFTAAVKIPYLLFAFEFALCAALMLLPTMFMGAAFPAAIRILSKDVHSIGASTGMCYAVNTLGCIAGSLITGFLLLPLLGIAVSLKALLAINAVIGLAFLIMDVPKNRIPNLSVAVALVCLAFFGHAFLKVKIPEDFLARLKSPQERIVRVCEGLENTVWESENTFNLQRSLWTNRTVLGRTLAVAPYEVCPQAIAGHIPMLLHAGNPERICGICLGTGQTFGSLLSYDIQRLDVVEISKAVVRLAETDFTPFNRDLLKDPRVRVHVEDGRNFIRFTRETYDLITLEPPPPEETGIVNLYSREFYRECRSRLNENGVLSQWLPIYNTTPEVTKRIIATFITEFPQAILWYNAADLMLLGFRGGLPGSSGKIIQRLARNDVRKDLSFSYTGSNLPGMDSLTGEYLSVPDNLFACFLMGPGELGRFSEKEAPITDDHPDLEYLYTSYEESADKAEWMVIYNTDSLKTHLADMHTYPGLIPQGNLESIAKIRSHYLEQLFATSYLKMATRHRRTSLEESINYCKKALDHNPEYGLAYYLLGDNYVEQEKQADALAAYEKAANYLPIVVDVWQKLAWAYKAVGRIDDAEKTLRHAEEIQNRYDSLPDGK